jgi:hypothetical protein
MYNTPTYARQMPQISYTPRMQYTAVQPSRIEVLTQVAHYQQHSPIPSTPMQEYTPQHTTSSFTYTQNLTNYFTPKTPTINHTPDNFLALYRPQTQFVDDAEQIESFVKETFEKTMNKPLPNNIIIRVLDKEDMQRIHETNTGTWSDGIQGFSINSKPLKQVFVKKGDLDRVMLVIGHEIGHVLTPTNKSKHDEEAKAFAFERAWMETIVKHNIADLKDNINLNFKPANNGLHDVAYHFVTKMIAQGKEALETYHKIAKGSLTIAG